MHFLVLFYFLLSIKGFMAVFLVASTTKTEQSLRSSPSSTYGKFLLPKCLLVWRLDILQKKGLPPWHRANQHIFRLRLKLSTSMLRWISTFLERAGLDPGKELCLDGKLCKYSNIYGTAYNELG